MSTPQDGHTTEQAQSNIASRTAVEMCDCDEWEAEAGGLCEFCIEARLDEHRSPIDEWAALCEAELDAAHLTGAYASSRYTG